MRKPIRDPVVASDEREAAASQWAIDHEPRTPGGQDYPDGLPGVPAALTGEETALRRLNPRSSRWPELDALDVKVHEMEAHIVELGERSGAAQERLLTADREDADRYAAWLLNRDGEQPEPEKPRLKRSATGPGGTWPAPRLRSAGCSSRRRASSPSIAPVSCATASPQRGTPGPVTSRRWAKPRTPAANWSSKWIHIDRPPVGEEGPNDDLNVRGLQGFDEEDLVTCRYTTPSGNSVTAIGFFTGRR